MFNHFLQKVCEPKIKQKYNRDVKLTLYGISIKPRNYRYNLIPKDELTQSQGKVSFFIDSNPSKLTPHNFVEGLILGDGRTFLNLQDATYYGGGFDKFLVDVHFDKRPLYPLDYVAEDPITENKLEFKKNNIKTKLLKESVILESRYNKKSAANFLFRRVTKEKLDDEFKDTYQYYSDNWSKRHKYRFENFDLFKKVFTTTIMDGVHGRLIDGFLETDDEIGELYDNVLEIIDDIYGNRIARLWTQKTGERV
jgi:hypothetical protein